MLRGQKKGESKYPMDLICERCGETYTIKRFRRSKLCPACASNLKQDYFDKRGEQFRTWLEGMKRYIKETEELLKERGEL